MENSEAQAHATLSCVTLNNELETWLITKEWDGQDSATCYLKVGVSRKSLTIA